MGIAKWCGHDSRGLPIPHDDLPKILDKFMEYQENGALEYDHLGFVIDEKDIKENVYLPKYYNPEITDQLKSLSATHDLLVLGDLMKKKQISIATGHEVGKLAYGTGTLRSSVHRKLRTGKSSSTPSTDYRRRSIPS